MRALIKYFAVSTEVIFPNLKCQVFTQTFELPMKDRTVTRANETAVILRTYCGDDPMRMTVEEFREHVLDPFQRYCPCRLEEPVYGSTYAGLDMENLKIQQENAMYLNNLVKMRDKLFYDMCPSYTNNPCAAAQAIRWVMLNNHGQDVVTPLAIHQHVQASNTSSP